MKVLLSIKPEYAEKIMSGEKKYEFRRKIFRRDGITAIVIYATSPVKKVVGEFVVSGIIRRDIDTLWNETHPLGGIDKDSFDTYFSGVDTGFAIEVGETTRYQNPINLCDIHNGPPPQSFAYI